jgi:hypothetical protein
MRADVMEALSVTKHYLRNRSVNRWKRIDELLALLEAKGASEVTLKHIRELRKNLDAERSLLGSILRDPSLV